MSVRINGKVLRNIPEQVSKNMSDIKALNEKILEKEYTIEDINIVDGHLIFTTYEGEQIDAGNLFDGNVNINGDLTADSIIENMSGYSYDVSEASPTVEPIYIGACKNGNKLTVVWACKITPVDQTDCYLGRIIVPTDTVGNKLIGIGATNILEYRSAILNEINDLSSVVDAKYYIEKDDIGSNRTYLIPRVYLTNATVSTEYYVRVEATFLLSDNLAA